MKISGLKKFLPSWQNAALAVLSAVLLILAFPGFEWWLTAWFAFIPLLFAVGRERGSVRRSFVTGWLFGTCFFFGTCWWLTFSPITYAGFPWLLAYFLLLCVCLMVGIFPAVFAATLSILLRRFGTWAILAAPFVWIFTEFLRFWITGNNWNAVAYSQAFSYGVRKYADWGGIYLVGFFVLVYQTLAAFALVRNEDEIRGVKHPPVHLAAWTAILSRLPFLNKGVSTNAKNIDAKRGGGRRTTLLYVTAFLLLFFGLPLINSFVNDTFFERPDPRDPNDIGYALIVAVQPNVPMDGLTMARYDELKRRHVAAAERVLDAGVERLLEKRIAFEPESARTDENKAEWRKVIAERFRAGRKVVIFPESPMNFMYEDDKEFQEWIRAFAVKNNASVLFNAAEPDPSNRKYFNSAVMVDPAGKKVGQYDKIYLVPFGETVPAPLQSIVPALVGSFSYGKEYDLLPFGDTKGGIMICFESHFPNLSREYVREGADVLVEMTNDGYLGPTPVLRQHLANAVFRAVETNRPLLRVTNVGISAYINERGEVIGPTEGYTEDTRVWNVSASDGSKTFYVRFGDWFAWLCSIVSVGLLVFAVGKRRRSIASPDQEV